MQIVYARKPKIHMLQKGKAVCGRHWLDGEEEGSKFAGSVDCKDCLRLLTKRALDNEQRVPFSGDPSELTSPFKSDLE